MKTEFTAVQLADPDTAVSAGAIRKCVHCGFCTATCPTYVLLGDELDSPRGRIYLIKNMLEEGRAPGEEDVRHVDRCLSCMACTTTCPSGVDYMHLVDHARAYIESNYRRPLRERAVRRLLALVLPHPWRFRAALHLARWTRPIGRFLARRLGMKSIGAMLELAPDRLAAPAADRPMSVTSPRGRILLLQGCAEPVLRPDYRAAALRLLARLGYQVVFAAGEGCCGALAHHMGRTRDSLQAARRNVDAWTRELEQGGVDAIVTVTSGCGTTLKDYGHLLREDPKYAAPARQVSERVQDISEFLSGTELPAAGAAAGVRVAYHAPCSLQHAQQAAGQAPALLSAAGFEVVQPAESHLCCGSAGTYNVLQPEIATRLGDRKARALEATGPAVIASGNVGCAVQIGRRTGLPVVHTVELLDWATGGPRPF